METRGFFRVDTSLNYNGNWLHSRSHVSYTEQNRIPALREICSAGDHTARELNRRVDSAGVELLLSDTNGSSRCSRSARSRAPSSVKRDRREYAERTEEHAQAALDLNRKALRLLIESIENTHQARIQAIRARQRFEDLLSVSLRHRERVRSRQRAENESIARTIGEARDQHCG